MNPRLLLLALAMMMLPGFVHSQESFDPKLVEGARKEGKESGIRP